MSALKQILQGRVIFEFYRDGHLYYRASGANGFKFTVPVSDTGTGTFLSEDKAIYFMRWIKPQYEARGLICTE